MTELHPDMERLLNRALDGEISEDEQIELNRAMLRDPDLHRMHDEYRSIDGLASAALRGTLPEGGVSFDPIALTHAAPARTRGVRHHPAWWLMPAAAAAVLVFSIVGPRFDKPGSAPTGTPLVGTSHALDSAVPAGGGIQAPRLRVGDGGGLDGSEARAVGYEPQSIKRVTDRDLLGVMGEDGRVYWLEVDRTRTLTRPKKSDRSKPVVGDL